MLGLLLTPVPQLDPSLRVNQIGARGDNGLEGYNVGARVCLRVGEREVGRIELVERTLSGREEASADDGWPVAQRVGPAEVVGEVGGNRARMDREREDLAIGVTRPRTVLEVDVLCERNVTPLALAVFGPLAERSATALDRVVANGAVLGSAPGGKLVAVRRCEDKARGRGRVGLGGAQ